MLTKDDLEKIRIIVREEVKAEAIKIKKSFIVDLKSHLLHASKKLNKLELRVEKTEKTLFHLQKGVTQTVQLIRKSNCV